MLMILFSSSPAQFRKWEKDRRLRFNALLDRLAAQLPSHTANCRWTKAQIVDNAIRHLKAIKEAAADDSASGVGGSAVAAISAVVTGRDSLELTNAQKLKLLSRQNRKLRELLR